MSTIEFSSPFQGANVAQMFPRVDSEEPSLTPSLSESVYFGVNAWKDRIAATKLGQRLDSFTEGTDEIGRAIKLDLSESTYKWHADQVASFAGFGAVKLAGIPQLPTILTVKSAETLKETIHIPILDTIVSSSGSGIGYGALGFVSTLLINNAANRVPNFFTKVSEQIPCTDTIADKFPGIEPDEPQTMNTRLRSGVAVWLGGGLGYVTAASLLKKTPKERSKLPETVAINGGIFMGLSTAAMSVVPQAAQMGEQFSASTSLLQQVPPEITETIANHATDPAVIFSAMVGLALGKMGLQKATNKFKELKQTRADARTTKVADLDPLV